MQLELRELRKQDYKKAIRFAITGMHFDWYMDSRVLLNLYGRYFWYLELTRATQVIAAYAEGTSQACCSPQSRVRRNGIVPFGNPCM